MLRPPTAEERKKLDEILARRFNTILAAQGLGVGSHRDRKALSDEAAKDAPEQHETRAHPHKASYIAIEAEAQLLLPPESRLIRREEIDPDTSAEVSVDPPPRPTFEEAQVAREEFPPACEAVREYHRRQRERRVKQGRKGKDGPRRKK